MIRKLIRRLRRVRPERPLTDYQKIFLASKCNGAPYQDPPSQPFALPKGTWLQKRLEERRE